ncbi:hypothetical protein BDV19DRAFT_395087 [Aspergillus venezuelensis]
MSDPFSAAASAVGVISLGLQVCQHLVTYCQAFKSYDRDIEMIRITALGLRQPLKDLRDLIEESQGVNPEITADLGEKALSLASMVGNLKSMVGQLDVGISTTGFAGRVKGHLGKAIYPFRRATLQDMLQDLHKIQAILQTTLSIYSTRIMRRVEVVQETLLEEVKQMRLDMQAIPSKQIPAPALIRSWCDCHSACSELIEDTHFKPNTRPIGPEALNNAGCDVELPRTQLQVNKARQSKKALVRTYRYTCTPLRLAITAFFSMSTGAGGFSIAPALTLQATLKFEGSIADQMMNRIFKKRPDDAEKVISSFIGRLQSAIIKGDMTPSALYLNESGVCLSLFDVNICPKPVITPSIDLIQIQYGWTTEGDPGLLPSIWTLTRFLVDHGALPNNSGYHGLLGGLIRHFVFDEELFTLAFYLVDHGGPWAPNFLDLTFTARSNIWYIFSRDESCNYELTKALKVHEMIGRTPEELAEITEENKQGVEILENLISEFEAKYNELSLTIWEFLEGYWHTRMVEYLCEHDPYGEEHDREARSMGVFLQPEEGVPLDRVSLLIGRRVKEIESVVTDSEDDSEDED